MSTDYQKLGWHEAGIIGMIIIGIILIVVIFVAALPESQHQNISSALDILDMHEAVATELSVMNFIAFEVPSEYMNQFYLAFTQVATIESSDLAELAILPQGLRIAYDSTLGQPMQYHGEVLGVAIQQGVGGCSPNISKDQDRLEMPYSFVQPIIKIPKVEFSF